MDPLTIALAIYGGYQGYKSSKGGSPLARIAGTALGAYGGYNLGTGITGSAIGQQYLPSFLTDKVTPGIGDMFSGINVFNPANTETANAVTNAITNEVPLGNVQKGIGAFDTPPGIDDLRQVGVYQPPQPITTSTNLPVGMTQETYDNLRAGTINNICVQSDSINPDTHNCLPCVTKLLFITWNITGIFLTKHSF